MNQAHFDAALERVAIAFEQGTLTKDAFVEAYGQAAAALGEGIEAEAIEALTKYADGPDWIDEAEARFGNEGPVHNPSARS